MKPLLMLFVALGLSACAADSEISGYGTVVATCTAAPIVAPAEYVEAIKKACEQYALISALD